MGPEMALMVLAVLEALAVLLCWKAVILMLGFLVVLGWLLGVGGGGMAWVLGSLSSPYPGAACMRLWDIHVTWFGRNNVTHK